jgi:hypothetical protein
MHFFFLLAILVSEVTKVVVVVVVVVVHQFAKSTCCICMHICMLPRCFGVLQKQIKTLHPLGKNPRWSSGFKCHPDDQKPRWSSGFKCHADDQKPRWSSGFKCHPRWSSLQAHTCNWQILARCLLLTWWGILIKQFFRLQTYILGWCTCTHHLSTSRVSQHPPIHHPLDAHYDSVVDEPHQWS